VTGQIQKVVSLVLSASPDQFILPVKVDGNNFLTYCVRLYNQTGFEVENEPFPLRECI
jgi:hypothetical protein